MPSPAVPYPMTSHPETLEKELRRVSQICHECRLCFSLCDTFPELFEFVDARDGDLDAVSFAELTSTAESCFECRLCYIKCPYTPPHRYALDFPQLMQQVKNHQASARGTRLPDRLISQPVLMGRLGSLAAPLMNAMSHVGFFRRIMQWLIGIDATRLMPTFYFETLERWMKKRPAKEGKPVVLFSTCFVNFHKPETGKAAVQVLEKLGYALAFPKQNCCGMPALDVGDEARAKKWARQTVEALFPFAEKGIPIVCPGPSCSLMLKNEIPKLLPEDEKARAVAEATHDLMAFLAAHPDELAPHLKKSAGKISYHFPCHLRMQNIGPKSRDVLNLIPDTRAVLIEQCSAMDGTWGLKAAHAEASRRLAGKLIKEIKTENVATDCPLAGLQIEEQTGRKPKHPVEIVWEAMQS